MLKIGLEKEAFLLKDGVPVVVPNELPKDDCGLLVEARGQAFTDPTQAIFSLKGAFHDIETKAAKLGFTVDESPIKEIDRDIVRKASRTHTKGLIQFRNLYGFKDHKHTTKEFPSGIHISFTKERHYSTKDGYQGIINEMFDFPSLFRYLDKTFKEEIKAAKRNPGFYEIKPDGRIEYRSLPSNIDLNKVLDTLKKFFTLKPDEIE